MDGKWPVWVIHIRAKNVGTITDGGISGYEYAVTSIDNRGMTSSQSNIPQVVSINGSTISQYNDVNFDPGLTEDSIVYLTREPNSGNIQQIDCTLAGKNDTSYPLNAFGIWDVTTPTPSSSATAGAQDSSTVGHIGSTFLSDSSQGECHVTLTGVKYFAKLSDVQWYYEGFAQSTPGVFPNVVGLEFTLTNVVATPSFVSLDGSTCTVTGQYGQSLDNLSNATYRMPDELTGFYVMPGQTISGWTYFSNPSAGKITKVEFESDATWTIQ